MFKHGVCGLLVVLCSMTVFSQELSFFSPEMRQSASRPQLAVMDFLERYFKDLFSQQQTTIQTKMADDKIFFRQGKPSDMYHVSDTMPFYVDLIGRYFEVTWLVDERPFVTLDFPAQYDLILGMDQSEAKKKLKETILTSPKRQSSGQTPTSLEKNDEGIYVSATDSFELVSLNDALYYNKVREGYEPVFSNEYVEYSAANMFQGLIQDVDYRMYVEQSMYGMKTISYSLTLNQWLNYCAEWGLKVFFAVEEVHEDGLLALVIAHSEELGYNHLLSVTIPDKFIADQRAALKVRLTPYIPLHNVKNLFSTEPNNRKKHLWQ